MIAHLLEVFRGIVANIVMLQGQYTRTCNSQYYMCTTVYDGAPSTTKPKSLPPFVAQRELEQFANLFLDYLILVVPKTIFFNVFCKLFFLYEWVTFQPLVLDKWLTIRPVGLDKWLPFWPACLDQWLTFQLIGLDEWLAFRTVGLDEWLMF